jgi:hypothetical protein
MCLRDLHLYPILHINNPPSPPFSKVGTTRNRGGLEGIYKEEEIWRSDIH